jgi:hypothetical protein
MLFHVNIRKSPVAAQAVQEPMATPSDNTVFSTVPSLDIRSQ